MAVSRLFRVIACVALGAFLSTACSAINGTDTSASATAGDISSISVGVSDSGTPTLTWPAGATFESSQTELMWDGEGDLLVPGQPLLLDVYIQSLVTGDVLMDTYTTLPMSRLLAPEFLGDELFTVLSTAHVGARVLSVSPPAGEFADETAIAIIIDVLPDRATGKDVLPNPDLPVVAEGTDGIPLITIDPEQTLPKDLKVATLIQGTGPQVEYGSYIVAQFVSVYAQDDPSGAGLWSAGDLKQSTWDIATKPFEGQIAEGKVIDAWLEGLIDVPVGSRVLIVAPEAWAYPGEGTVVYVVDILDSLSLSEYVDSELSASPSPSPAEGTP